ncbi:MULTISPECIES: DNA adenine methylase [unclassified Paraburkholderia]|uniref:DNA adenine methylase n=1 Tax=unclassified Paraburkholderia TaxID=2615204 RepID=UPI0016126930|nr:MULTISPECIES: DNA adenine methylase [unclassified Paraburkholderia]MBB5447110.1 DNA adenine methylase [Paraburkholderia sp. WSM4177]MBB5487651.1 DNA adenine methylase [Paraburkholderia sp. WSM4180]
MNKATPAAAITAPLISYFGGKFRLAAWVLSHLPPHEIYVEPFGGAASVLLQKPRSKGEIYNDLDGEIVNLFRVVRDRAWRARLIDALTLTPYSRVEFAEVWGGTPDPVERARRLCVRAQMGFGAMASTRPLQSSTGFAADMQSDGAKQWSRYPKRLGAIGERLQGVMIENRPAVELIAHHDAPDVLFYVDPPYLPETRSGHADGGGRDYRHEMTTLEHADLLAMLANLRGMAVVSGYASPIYERALAGWARVSHKSRAQGQRGSVAREETLWISPSACAASGIEPGHVKSSGDETELPLFVEAAGRT